jgi:glycerate kinase
VTVLVAPDSFKGTFTAGEVAEAIAADVSAADPCPVADGGEGTLDIVLRACGGHSTTVPAHDALGRRITARLGWLDDGAVALVETAQASGLGLIAPSDRNAEASTTWGTGEMIMSAVATGATSIVVTVGGSATTDGGLGAVRAIDDNGGLRGATLIVACDVTTTFERAAPVYASQKGADAAGVERLSRRMDRIARSFDRDPRGRPMTGAAGGLSGALWAQYDALLVPGAAWVLDAIGFDSRLGRCEIVITGEGRLDAQTFEGKLVGEVAARASAAGKPVHAVVGSSSLTNSQAQRLGLASVTIASNRQEMRAAGRSLASGRRLQAPR